MKKTLLYSFIISATPLLHAQPNTPEDMPIALSNSSSAATPNNSTNIPQEAQESLVNIAIKTACFPYHRGLKSLCCSSWKQFNNVRKNRTAATLDFLKAVSIVACSTAWALRNEIYDAVDDLDTDTISSVAISSAIATAYTLQNEYIQNKIKAWIARQNFRKMAYDFAKGTCIGLAEDQLVNSLYTTLSEDPELLAAALYHATIEQQDDGETSNEE